MSDINGKTICDKNNKDESLKTLRKIIQYAIDVEFSTIPTYMTALFSMKDKSCEAYRLTRNVMMEEMYHTIQASNLLVAVGGAPQFTGGDTPGCKAPYPKYLPYGNEGVVPFLPLSRATTELFKNVFMHIETPSEAGAPPQLDYDTIGQFYAYATEYLKCCIEHFPDDVFKTKPGYTQRTNLFIGKFGGKLIEVKDAKSALLAVTEIVQQGEGALPPKNHLYPYEPWAVYNHYGQRVDGTFGPILGTPVELSHYFSFKKIAEGTAPIPEVYPIVANPQNDKYENPKAKERADDFNTVYNSILYLLRDSFLEGDVHEANYFNKAMYYMHTCLPKLADELMQTPIWTDGDKTVGPNATPTFLLHEILKVGEILDHKVITEKVEAIMMKLEVVYV